MSEGILEYNSPHVKLLSRLTFKKWVSLKELYGRVCEERSNYWKSC